MHKEFKFDDAARKEMLDGINIVSKACCSTLGPSGRLVMIPKHDSVNATKDGISVIRGCLPLKSPFADMGARLVRSASNRTVIEAADGTTLTCLLLAYLANEGLRLVASGNNPVHLKQGIEYGIKQVIEMLLGISKPITTPAEIEQVAVISANGDKEIGSLLRQAYEKVGNSGIISVGKSPTTSTTLEVVPGYKFDRGFLSQHFINTNKMECVLEDARILITDTEINNVNTILPILELCKKQYGNKPLLIISSNCCGDALPTLCVNAIRKSFISCAVRCPGYGNTRTEMINDIAVLSGSTVVSDTSGLKLEHFDTAWLGGAEKVIINANSTTIVNGYGSEEAVEERVAQIRSVISQCDDTHDLKQHKERLAKLVGGVASIYCGGFSEEEINEKLDRYDDALGATRSAIESGVVSGGGTALLKIARNFDMSKVPEELKYGVGIVLKAIQEPIKKIASNAGKEPAEIVLGVLQNSNPNFGYNAQSDKFEDLMESGVLDPVKVIRCALQNSASVAGLILTTDCMIANIDDETEPKKQ